MYRFSRSFPDSPGRAPVFNEPSYHRGSGSDSVLVLVFPVGRRSPAVWSADGAGPPERRSSEPNTDHGGWVSSQEHGHGRAEPWAGGDEGCVRSWRSAAGTCPDFSKDCFKELCRESRSMSGRRMDGRVTLTWPHCD